MTFKTWKEQKDEMLREKLRQKRKEEKKVEDKKKEEMEKKRDADMVCCEHVSTSHSTAQEEFYIHRICESILLSE